MLYVTSVAEQAEALASVIKYIVLTRSTVPAETSASYSACVRDTWAATSCVLFILRFPANTSLPDQSNVLAFERALFVVPFPTIST